MISDIITIQELTRDYTDHTLVYAFNMTTSTISFSYSFINSNGKLVRLHEDTCKNDNSGRLTLSIMVSDMKEFYSSLPTKKN